jgi:hypothetical protein
MIRLGHDARGGDRDIDCLRHGLRQNGDAELCRIGRWRARRPVRAGWQSLVHRTIRRETWPARAKGRS